MYLEILSIFGSCKIVIVGIISAQFRLFRIQSETHSIFCREKCVCRGCQVISHCLFGLVCSIS